MDFEPKILGIACNWCTYTGADLARNYAAEISAKPACCAGDVFQPDQSFIHIPGVSAGCGRRAGRWLPSRRLPL